MALTCSAAPGSPIAAPASPIAAPGSPIAAPGSPLPGPAIFLPCQPGSMPAHFLPAALPACGPPSPHSNAMPAHFLPAGLLDDKTCSSPQPPSSPMNDAQSPMQSPQLMPQQMVFMLMQPSQHGFGCNNAGMQPQHFSPTKGHGTALTKLDEEEVAEQESLVLLSGLPATLCDPCFLEVMLEQAGLGSALLGFEVQRQGEVLVKLNSRAAATQCAAHFQNCKWGSKGMQEVRVTFPGRDEAYPKRKVAKAKFAQNQNRPRSYPSSPAHSALPMPSSPTFSALRMPGSPSFSALSSGPHKLSWASLSEEDSTYAGTSASTMNESGVDDCGYGTDDGF